MSSKQAENDQNESLTSDVQEESEYSSEDDVDPREASLFGSMRTRLRWEPDINTLSLDVKQYVQNRRKLEVRYKGRLNTHSGDYKYTAQVQRIMSQNTPSLARIMAAEQGMTLEGEDGINDTTRFLPAGLKTLLVRDWTLAPGLRLATQGKAAPLLAQPAAEAAADVPADEGALVPAGSSSGSSGLRYCVTLRKQPQVLLRRGVWDSWLEGKADVEVDAGQQAVGFRGALRLKVLRLNLTDKQDLQLAVGADYVSGSSSSRRAGYDSSCALTPYIKVSENSWAVRLSRGCLAFTYDI